MSELPGQWKAVRIRDVIIPFETVDPTRTPDSSFTYVDIGSIDNQTQSIRDPKVILGKDAPSRARRRIQAGDVLFSTVRTYLKNIAVVPRELDGAVTSTGIAVLRPSRDIESRFLFNWTRSAEFLGRIGKAMDGTMYPAVTDRDVLDQFIPLPPVDEQHRIVAKVDILLRRSASAREELARIPRLVERYKQAILAAAFRGDATTDWRKHHPNQSADAVRVVQKRAVNRKREGGSKTSSTVGSLPDSWQAVTVDSVGEVILGRQRSPENHNGPNMRPYVRAANITWDGWDLSDVKKMNFDDHDFKKFKLQSGDVLINEGSGSADEVGKPAVWNGEIKNCCFQNTLIAVRPYAAVTSEYLYHVLLNAALSRAFVDEARGVNIHHIGRAGLAQFVIALPPIEEQREISRRIKNAFERIEKLLAEASRASQLLGRLDQATLAKAFRGELTL